LPQKPFAMNLSWRVHWLSDKYRRSAVIEFALEPIDLLLFREPFRRQRIWAQGAPTSPEQRDHFQGVVALFRLKP